MLDLNERLKSVERVAVPDMWEDALARAMAAPDRDRNLRRVADPSWRRLGTVTVAFAIFVGAVLFAWRLWSPAAEAPATSTPSISNAPVPVEEPTAWPGLAPGINEIPPPPSGPRISPAMAWTGDRFIVWGGGIDDGAVLFDDGFEFDPATQSWAKLPPSPLSARYFPASVWTGSELVIWGGWAPPGNHPDDGAAYDPATRTWRTIAAAPLYGHVPVGAVWTGSEMLVWGSSGASDDARDVTGAAYDPAADTWRTIADGPFPINWGSVAWTGREMIVVGASVHGPNRSDTRYAVGAAYDPATDSWSQLPPADLDPNGTFAVWANTELFVLDYLHQARAYDPRSDTWRRLPRPPTRAGEAWPVFDTAGGYVFASTFGGTVVYDLARETWTAVDLPRPADGVIYPTHAGDAMVLWESGSREGSQPYLMLWKP